MIVFSAIEKSGVILITRYLSNLILQVDVTKKILQREDWPVEAVIQQVLEEMLLISIIAVDVGLLDCIVKVIRSDGINYVGQLPHDVLEWFRFLNEGCDNNVGSISFELSLFSVV